MISCNVGQPSVCRTISLRKWFNFFKSTWIGVQVLVGIGVGVVVLVLVLAVILRVGDGVRLNNWSSWDFGLDRGRWYESSESGDLNKFDARKNNYNQQINR